MSHHQSDSSLPGARWIAAVALGVLIGASAIWLGLEAAWAVSLAVALFAATAAIAFVRHLSHNRAQKRQAALDAYVARELARAPTLAGPHGSRVRPAFTATLDRS